MYGCVCATLVLYLSLSGIPPFFCVFSIFASFLPLPRKTHTHTHTISLYLSIYLSICLSIYLSYIYLPCILLLHFSIFIGFTFLLAPFMYLISHVALSFFSDWELIVDMLPNVWMLDSRLVTGLLSSVFALVLAILSLSCFFFSLLTISFFSFILFYFIFSPILSSYH